MLGAGHLLTFRPIGRTGTERTGRAMLAGFRRARLKLRGMILGGARHLPAQTASWSGVHADDWRGYFPGAAQAAVARRGAEVASLEALFALPSFAGAR